MATIAPALSLVVIMWCAYFPATRADFIWDDNEHFIEDKLMTDPDGLYRIWLQPDDSVWNYWPLSRTSFWLERRAWGINAAASHAVNILLHLASVLILYFGLRHFRVPNAWFIAALFAIHPIFVESVAWITERKNVLSGVFYLLCLWSYLHFDDQRKWRWYLCALFLFLCALLSKSSTVMLPVILVFARLALRRPWTGRDCFQLIPFFLLSLAAACGNIWFEEHFIGSRGAEFDRSLAEKVAVAGRIPFFYLRQILYPYPLVFVYPRWNIDTGSVTAYLPAVGVIVLTLVLLKNDSTWGRPLALGLGAFVATLFPILNFFDVYGMRFSFVADHWVYLAALPVLILAGVGLGSLPRVSPSVRWTVCGAILAACGILTWQHNQVFQNRTVLWNHTLVHNPECWLAHTNLGLVLQNAGKIDQAIVHYHEALRLKPDCDDAHNNLGNALFEKGLMHEAIPHYFEALRIRRNFEDAHYNLGIVLARLGRYDEAIQHYKLALGIKTDFEEAHYNLANALMKQGRTDAAIAHYREALQTRPDYANAHNNLGAALLEKGDARAAIDHFREALRIQPGIANARENLNRALASQPRNQ